MAIELGADVAGTVDEQHFDFQPGTPIVKKILNRECDVDTSFEVLTHHPSAIFPLPLLVFGRLVDSLASALRKPLAPFIVDELPVKGV